MEPLSSRLGIGRTTAHGVLLPTLLFYYPEKEKRWKLEVQSDRFTIGRSREVEVCIPHTSVSKKHLLVERRGPKYIFRDLGSKNGSFLNDFRMARGSLSDGDELRVGSIRITFYRAAAPEDALQTAGVTGAPSPATEGKPEEGTTTSSGPPPPSRAEQETAALPRRELADRLQGPRAEPPLDPLPIEIEEEFLETGADPEIGAEDEGGDTAHPSPERPRHRRAGGPAPVEEPPVPLTSARTISAALLWGGALACVAAGFVLGYVAANLRSGEGESTASSTAAPPPPRAPGPAVGGPGAPAAGAAVTAPADISDPATHRRLIVRLHIDLLGRPPTREELRSFEKLSREELWYEITKRAEKAAGAPRTPEKPEEAFSRMLGRPPATEEMTALLQAAGGDLDYFAAAAGTSALYASPEHRRKRREVILARSLFTDLVGYPPGSTEEKTVLEALRASKDGVGPVAATLSGSPGSLAGPRLGELPEAWVDDVYARFLLRPPTVEERKAGAGAARDGWRGWLAGIASGREYETY